MILVDSSVLIDVLQSKVGWAQRSAEALHRASIQERLAINAIVYAEIATSFESAQGLDAALLELKITVDPIPAHAAFAAATAHAKYRETGGAKSSTLPDFFIGAHACFKGWALLTRDPKRVRTYFPDLEVIEP